MAPTTTTHGSTRRPGFGSATRARPIGISGDNATESVAPIAAATMPSAPTRSIPDVHTCDLVIPSAPTVG